MTTKSPFSSAAAAAAVMLASAAAVVMLASCSKDGAEAADDMVLRLSAENILSRVSGSGLQLTQFASGEKVAVFLAENVDGTATTGGDGVTVYDQPLKYTADGSGGLEFYSTGGTWSVRKPQYWPESGRGLFIYGVYPADAAASHDGENIFSVQTDQSSADGYKASDLMTGAPAQNPAARTVQKVQINFNHLLTKIDVSLTAGDGFAEDDLSSAAVYITNTLPSVRFSADGETFGTVTDGDRIDIKVCSGTAGAAIIAPQTVSAGTAFIKVVVGGGTYVHKLTSDVTFAGKSAYTYNITVNKTGLSVTSNIIAWTTGGTTSGSATLE